MGSFAYQPGQDPNYRSKTSLESEKTVSTRPSQNASIPSDDPRIKEADLTDPLEIELLKEELRRKDEEIRRLLQYDRSRTPVAPPRPDPTRSLTPLELYQLGAAPHTPSHSVSPLAKPKSVSPFRGAEVKSVFAANGGLVAQDSMAVHDLARLPAFQQPKYTTKHPKVHADNPITGEWHVGLARMQTDDGRRGFADYGSMLMAPFKGGEAQTGHRKQL